MSEGGGLRSGEEAAKESPWPLSRESCMEGAAGEAMLGIVAASRSWRLPWRVRIKVGAEGKREKT